MTAGKEVFMATAFPLQIFYDGACLVCATEIGHYRKRNPQNRLAFIDIRGDAFDPGAYGKSQADFMAQMHVLDAEGTFYTGVDAFMTLWQAYPSGSLYRLLSAVLGLPGINLASRIGYRLFARYRHLLPKRKPECASGTCNLSDRS